jgi:hypothetical protein
MSLCFNSILKTPAQPDGPGRTLEIMDLGQMLADRYGVHNVEMQHAHFASTDAKYLKDFRDRLAKSKSRVTNINLEFGPVNISADDLMMRQQAVERTKLWIDYAVALGCPRIMVNQERPNEVNKPLAIAALNAMSDGKSKKVMVAMEDRGGGGARRGAPPPPRLSAHRRGSCSSRSRRRRRLCELRSRQLPRSGRHAGIRGMFPLTDGNCRGAQSARRLAGLQLVRR